MSENYDFTSKCSLFKWYEVEFHDKKKKSINWKTARGSGVASALIYRWCAAWSACRLWPIKKRREWPDVVNNTSSRSCVLSIFRSQLLSPDEWKGLPSFKQANVWNTAWPILSEVNRAARPRQQKRSPRPTEPRWRLLVNALRHVHLWVFTHCHVTERHICI